MGWEFRIFFRPGSSDAPRVLPDLGSKSHDEIRTDEYLPHSSTVGCKRRNCDTIEDKIRKDLDEQNFEKWEKSRVYGSIDKFLSTNGLPLLADVSGAGRKLVAVVEKRRTKVSFGDYDVEETGIVLRLRDDESPSTEPDVRVLIFDSSLCVLIYIR